MCLVYFYIIPSLEVLMATGALSGHLCAFWFFVSVINVSEYLLPPFFFFFLDDSCSVLDKFSIV